jgi:hypothetical protein
MNTSQVKIRIECLKSGVMLSSLNSHSNSKMFGDINFVLEILIIFLHGFDTR